MARLVVVSNRVGVPDRGKPPRAGGLEVAIKSALKRHRGVWFGWSGKIEDTVGPRTVEAENISYVVISLRQEDYQEFYNGFANRVLWPILHYRLDLAEFSRRDLGGYLRVNGYFAQNLGQILQPDDIVWVQDYHLIPLAKALRERGHQNRMGFFLHVPLPPPEVLTALPNHERLIPALTQYDLIGLQTETDVANLARYFAAECRLPRNGDGSFVAGDRVLRIAAFPVGVEVDTLARLARRAVQSKFVQDVLDSLSGRLLLVGVDRLDYSKGIPERMQAFERFLATYPDWRGKVTYLQITPRSRTDIPEYVDIARVVGEAAGRINGTYGEASWTPIRYINRAHSRTALVGLYRAARVALVTPLRDGMNLVAKEFVAAQDPEDLGVLVLSRFAGAACELAAALIVNPYDPEGVSAAIDRALSMPLSERQKRQRAMLEILSRNDLRFWAERFIDALEHGALAPSWIRPASGLADMGKYPPG